MKRRTLALALGGLLALSLCACGNAAEPQNADSGKQQQEQQEPKQEQTPEPKQEKVEFAIGETWTVDGQWTLTVTSVEETQYRNEYSDKAPGAVYMVNYTYSNIGYEDKNGIMDGLFISMDDSIVDAGGIMGYSYPGDITNYAQETPVGATCNAQSCIGVDNPGSFKINVIMYDGNGNKQSATFNLSV